MKKPDIRFPVLVAGAGISGMNSAALLLRQGYRVWLYDERQVPDTQKLLRELPEAAERLTVIGGELPKVLPAFSVCVISPGIPVDKPFAQRLRQAGIPVVSEISLAGAFAQGRIAAITGTNGKTSTTSLLGHILEGYFQDVHVVGNIGRAYTSEAEKTGPDSVTAAELSSFQLETMDDFAPDVSAVLNITPDHLNRHLTMENYAAIKKKICRFQTEDQVCILNLEDPLLQDVPAMTRAKILWFSSQRESDEGGYMKDGSLYLHLGDKREELCSCRELLLVGRHNYENVLAAALAAISLGVPTEVIRERVKTFRAVEHRIEYVRTVRGVSYYNDSKGTNPDAAIKAIESMPGPTCLIAGGYDKKADYTEWLRSCRGRVKLLILFGQTAAEIEKVCRRENAAEVLRVDSLEEAVAAAADHAAAGEYVLLSPACASWDMFSDYEERGRRFKELVRNLSEKE